MPRVVSPINVEVVTRARIEPVCELIRVTVQMFMAHVVVGSEERGPRRVLCSVGRVCTKVCQRQRSVSRRRQ